MRDIRRSAFEDARFGPRRVLQTFGIARIHNPVRFAAAPTLSHPSFPSIRVAFTAPSFGLITNVPPIFGDASLFRSIAQETLATADRGNIAAARMRIEDSETTWDESEPSLRPKDAEAWTTLDTMIDAMATNVRTPSPQTDGSDGSLKAQVT